MQKVCALAPGGGAVYPMLQRRFGSLTDDPFRRLPQSVAVRVLADTDQDLPNGGDDPVVVELTRSDSATHRKSGPRGGRDPGSP